MDLMLFEYCYERRQTKTVNHDTLTVATGKTTMSDNLKKNYIRVRRNDAMMYQIMSSRQLSSYVVALVLAEGVTIRTTFPTVRPD
jgi:hypothetical protein